MTPEQEIARIKKDFAARWHRIEKLPEVQKAISDKNPVLLAELASKEAWGNFGTVDSKERKRIQDLKSYRSPDDENSI